MKITQRSRRMVRLQNILFVVMFVAVLGLLAWLSNSYSLQADWTASGRNSLSQASIDLLDEVSAPLRITAFTRDNRLLRKRISELVARYQRHKQDIHLSFVNPDLEPQRVRDLGITMDGELLLEYQGRNEKLQELSEHGLSNALQRLLRGAERLLAFVTGHGERSLAGGASYDLDNWAAQLRGKGFRLQELNLARDGAIPAQTTVLVIAGPQADLLPAEVERIIDYVSGGGNLLWLADPGSMHGLEKLAEYLEMQAYPGVVIDPNVSQVGMMLFGTDDPRITLVAQYGNHAVTRNFKLNTLFPLAAALHSVTDKRWHHEVLLQTLSNAWAETSLKVGNVSYDEGRDTAGPLVIGYALGRTEAQEPPQRVVMLGDGDFVSNGFLGMGGNLQLGMNIINWLSSDEQLIDIPARITRDASLELSSSGKLVIFFSFLLLLPGLLLVSGLTLWWRRRRH